MSVHPVASDVQKLSFGVLSHCGSSLLDAERKVLNLDHDARLHDLPNGFPAMRSHNVEREARASAAQQFDAVDSGDEGVRDGCRGHSPWQTVEHFHCRPPFRAGASSRNFRDTYKTDALTGIAGDLLRVCFQFSSNDYRITADLHRVSARHEQSARQVSGVRGGQARTSCPHSHRAVAPLRGRDGVRFFPLQFSQSQVRESARKRGCS